MAEVQTILTKFEVDISDLQNELRQLQADFKASQKAGQQSAEKVEQSEKELGAEVKKVTDSVQKQGSEFTKTGKQGNSAVDGLTKNLKKVAGAVGIAFGIREVLNFTKSVIQLTSRIEENFSQIENLVGVTGAALEQLRQGVETVSITTGQTQEDLSSALFAITSAGLRGAEALEVLEKSAKASVIGLGETRAIALATGAVIQAYGADNINAAQATDILTATIREGNLEASSFAPVIGRVVGLAAQLGVGFDELGANVATYTRLGVSAEQATTGLEGILRAINKPTDDAKKALGEVNLTFEDLRKKIREDGLAAALVELTELYGDNTEALGRVIPESTAFANVLGTAAAQGEEYLRISEGIADSAGILDSAYASASQTLEKQFNIALATVQASLIKLGQSASKPLLNIVKGFNQLTGALDANVRAIEEERVGLDLLVRQILLTNEGSEERVRLINDLNLAYPGFLANLKEEELTNEKIASLLRDANLSYIERIAFTTKQNEVDKAAAKAAESLIDVEEKRARVLDILRQAQEKYNIEIDKTADLETQVDIVARQLRTIGGDVGRALSPAIDLEFRLQQSFRFLEIDEAQLQAAEQNYEKLLEELQARVPPKPITPPVKFDINTATIQELRAELARINQEIQKSNDRAVIAGLQSTALLIEAQIKKLLSTTDVVGLLEGLEKKISEVDEKIKKATSKETIKNLTEFRKKIQEQIDELLRPDIDTLAPTFGAITQSIIDDFNKTLDGYEGVLDARIKAIKERAEQLALKPEPEDEVRDPFDTSAFLERQGIALSDFAKTYEDFAQEINEANIDIIAESIGAFGGIGKSIAEAFGLSAEASKAFLAFEKLSAITQVIIALSRELALINANPALNLIDPFTGTSLKVAYASQAKTRAAINIATIAATAIPEFAFATGTADAPGGLSLVGEKGPEIMQVPKGARIFTAEASKRERPLIEALNRGDVEDYIRDVYVAPALMEASVAPQVIQNTTSNMTFDDFQLRQAIRSNKVIELGDNTISKLKPRTLKRLR